MKKAFMAAIRFYQKGISPLYPPRCRYIPTCSEYALEAVEKYVALKMVYWIFLKTPLVYIISFVALHILFLELSPM